ncbi:serine-protein kinase ATM [Battus philenor]|uniref:serine-protein kinase ATM n=1 Tax=Battus philenor TaxID=42288 RepID=UPI0035D06A21
MSLEVTVREISGNLTTNKALERKKNAELLKDYLTRNAVPDLLSDNTRRKVGFSWNDLFQNVTDYLLKEAEKYETSKTFHSVTYPLCSSVLLLSVAGSNKGRAYIKCEKIMEACLFVLQNNRLTKAFGDAYLTLLYKHVLTIENYSCLVTPSTWEDLLDVTITACNSNISKLDDFVKLKILWLIIKNAGAYCQFAPLLQSSLAKISEYFQKINRTKKIIEVVIDIMMLIMDMLYLETRLHICEFIEKNLPLIFEFYDQNLDHKKKLQLHKLLHMSIKIHHPLGQIQNEKSALAYDWDAWNRCIQSIMDLICLEISYIQKCNKNNNIVNTCISFDQIAAFIYFLSFKKSIQEAENNFYDGNCIKKPRTTLNESKKFSDLLQEFQTNFIPWISILKEYVEHFGYSISAADYKLLVQIIEELVNINKSNEIWCHFQSLACLVLQNLKTKNEVRTMDCKRLITSLWNSCLRHSTSGVLAAQVAIHSVIQTILSLKILDYYCVKPLLVLYFEKGMPVNNSSLKTLNILFEHFYSKCCYNFGRIKCLTWFINSGVTNADVDNVNTLFLKLLTNENISTYKYSEHLENFDLYTIIYKNIEKSILYSTFELEIAEHKTIYNKCTLHGLEIIDQVNNSLLQFLEDRLDEYYANFQKEEFVLLECIKMLRIVLVYLNIILKYYSQNNSSMQLLVKFKRIFKITCTAAIHRLKSDAQVYEKLRVIEVFQLIYLEDYVAQLNKEVRLCIDDNFFHCLNNILCSNVPIDEEDCDIEMSMNSLKHNCIFLLAAYCKKHSNYRQELLELILNSELYNMSSQQDIESALKCIRLLNQSDIENAPLESTFVLMQSMCKDVFRNPKATLGILEILLKIIDKLWQHSDSLRRNCVIMVKSYLHRCESLYYPPEVAALVYKCVAKIIAISCNENYPIDPMFRDILYEKVKGNLQSLRLYCSDLIKEIPEFFSQENFDSYLKKLKNIFTTVVSDNNEAFLKDELRNRTAALLHTCFIMALSKPSKIHQIVLEILLLQQERSLDEHLVKKVLNTIISKTTCKGVDNYLEKNILLLLQCWSQKINKSLRDLPLNLFECESIHLISTKYMSWLVSADILWRQQGIVHASEMLQKFKQDMPEELILEKSFSNIIILSLPYIVNEKYNLGIKNDLGCKENISAATRMFQQMRQILKNENWTKLFVENMDQLVLFTALHLKDYLGTKEMFAVDVSQAIETYSYSEEVFCAILKYFGELIDGNIMEYFCENQPLALFKVIFTLWDSVLTEKQFDYQVISLHSFIIVINNIPLGFPSDAVICNFACLGIANFMKTSESPELIGVLCKALLLILKRFFLYKVLHKNTLSNIVSVLMLKKNTYVECKIVLEFVMEKFIQVDKDLEALCNVVSGVKKETCSTKVIFLDKLQAFQSNLLNASVATLKNLKTFLTTHKIFLKSTLDDLDSKGFSEDCDNSVIHKIIVALCNISRNSLDDTMLVAASDCLAEIGTYDLKTLVTVPPNDTTKLINLRPPEYFTFAVVKSLLEMLFDENPVISLKMTNALYHVMTFKDGVSINIDADAVDNQILKSLTSPACESFAKYSIQRASNRWVPASNEDHFQWVTRITVDLLETLDSQSNYLSSLREISNYKPNLCHKILPSLVGLLLEHSAEDQVHIIGQRLNEVLSYFWNKTYKDYAVDGIDGTVSKISNILDDNQKMIVHWLLEVVDVIRLQRINFKTRKFREADTLKFLKLEYEKLAWAATLADKNIVAIYYGELWAMAENGGVPPSTPEATANLHGGENVQRILRNCYISIGELDAIDGCGTAHLTSEDEKRNYLLNMSQYTDALLLHDIALSNGSKMYNRLQHGVVMSLHKSGMHHLALQYINSYPENEQLNDVKYDCLSFLGDWSEIVDTKELEEKTKKSQWNLDVVIKSYRYACLKECLNADPKQGLEERLTRILTGAKLAITKLCVFLNMENCQNVYKVIGNLHLLRDIQDYCSVRCGKVCFSELLARWEIEKQLPFKEFRHLETLFSQRSLILEHAAKQYENLSSNIIDLQLHFVDLAINNDRVQTAQRLLESTKKLKMNDKVALVESQITWAKGHRDIALALLHGVICDDLPDTQLGAIALRQYGLWMAECKRENARDIINKYLEKSLDMLKETDHAETRFKVYHDIAKFADSEYKQIVSYMNSSVFENKVKCIENMKDTAASLKVSQQSLTKDERKALLTNNRFMQLDEAEVINTRVEKQSFLNLAMRYYLLSLKYCEDNNLSIFRVISLWFDNPDFEFEDTKTNLRELLRAIPSWKYIMVLPQLAPRLTTVNSGFSNYLMEILEICATEHPLHTLPILFNLKNSDKDNCILNASKGKSSSSGRVPSQPEPRVAAADALVRQLSQRRTLTRIISQMELMCDAFISFAYFTPKVNIMKPQPVPSAEPLSKLRDLDALPIPTVDFPIAKNGDYSTLAHITAFEKSFELVGGINYPKKITCRNSKGQKKILLIKGEDDLRQDAVMQQVFNIVNTLLENNPITNKNKLIIRTYKVVPMSRRSGVLGWCEGTMPLGVYLLEAHTSYRPQDITPSAARTKLKACHDNRKTNQEKQRVFMEILANFKPVFHNFFTEHYHDPITWYERRLAYTRSVATSSMVGYILGLGDRHVQNILIDKRTAEVVHIDFGIAFDQGKALPTPETVPFRLTQDIIAGFGCCGIEGIFRRCCEKTLQLLRDNQETLLTILEVLLCDPLYSWTVKGTFKERNSHQNSVQEGSSARSGLAERALLAVGSKLSGAEGSAPGAVAVPGHVARLLQTATDPANLSRLFPGWQPYL